ncbi:MAG TPA: hypothetical protein VEY09_04525 [Pyrinomonadaceae bacterium]|nr:hypothetical protein [Pyrinomonadaceae bacterium]
MSFLHAALEQHLTAKSVRERNVQDWLEVFDIEMSYAEIEALTQEIYKRVVNTTKGTYAEFLIVLEERGLIVQPTAPVPHPPLVSATARLDRLRRYSPACPECGEMIQIQLCDWHSIPAGWKCRMCKHKFNDEPPKGDTDRA